MDLEHYEAMYQTFEDDLEDILMEIGTKSDKLFEMTMSNLFDTEIVDEWYKDGLGIIRKNYPEYEEGFKGKVQRIIAKKSCK